MSTAKAVGELREAGLTMDPTLVYAEVAAHDKELDSAVSNPNLVASKADFAAVNEALARMIAFADEQHSLSPQCFPREQGAPDEVSCRQQLG